MPRFLPAATLFIALILALACGGSDDNDDATTGPTGAGTIASPTTAATTGSSDDKPTPAPTPEPGAVSVANEPFSVETSDGVVLKGHAYTPDGPKRQALIIVAPVDQSTWAESTRAFTSEGIAVFTFDLPGYGETGGDEAEPGALAADVRLLTRFVISREYPLVYMAGFGETGGALVTDAPTFQDLQPVVGTITYGYAAESSEDILAIAPETAWDGENVLAESTVIEPMLDFILDGN